VKLRRSLSCPIQSRLPPPDFAGALEQSTMSRNPERNWHTFIFSRKNGDATPPPV